MFAEYFHKFPRPKYLGSKYRHREWILQHIPDSVSSVLDAFSGSQSIAYGLKTQGRKVITNDFLMSNYIIGKAIIENNSDKLELEDINILFQHNSNPEEFCLIRKLFSGLFFTDNEAELLDGFRSNLNRLSEYKKSLAACVMCRSMTRKVAMGHFAHTKTLEYTKNRDKVYRNKSLALPLKDIFLSLVDEYNNSIFDNRQDNKSYCENILDLIPEIQVDLAYFDPPYCGGHSDYQSFYHVLETFVRYWKDKKFVNSINRYEPKLNSHFDTKTEIKSSLDKLFQKSVHIPYWLISYNDSSVPDIRTLIGMIKIYRSKVEVTEMPYQKSNGGRGSKSGSKEVLILCN